jgi:murein DD-endopeptidase MepM/ murein hydrolase activator NlpD
VRHNRYKGNSRSPFLKRQFLRVVLILSGLLIVLPLILFLSKTESSLPGKSMFSRFFPTDKGEQGFEGAARDSAPQLSSDFGPDAIDTQEEHETVGPLERIVRVAQGDTLINLLLQAGIARTEAHATVSALKNVYNPRQLRPGQEVILTFQPHPENEEGEVFQGLKLQVDVDRNVLVRRQDEEMQFTAAEEKWELHKGDSAVSGTIVSSLYDAAIQNDLPLSALMQMVRAFSFDVDFQRDIHPGDRFQVLYEQHVDDNGEVLRVGDVAYASLETRGRTKRIYRYTALDGEIDYFDEKGRSVRKSLMLTPIDGARLSSGYGMRRHPILGYSRMHRGLDFAAPSGTPIMAAGNGVLTFVGRKGNYGNTVQIRHSGGYATLYAHMRGFARGIRTGVRVNQGQTIGYVGNTGMSTGPHLHYEVMLNGKHVNPSAISSTPGRILAGKDLERFKQVKLDLEHHYASAMEERMAAVEQPRSM